MKNRFLKSMMSLALAGALLVGSTGSALAAQPADVSSSQITEPGTDVLTEAAPQAEPEVPAEGNNAEALGTLTPSIAQPTLKADDSLYQFTITFPTRPDDDVNVEWKVTASNTGSTVASGTQSYWASDDSGYYFTIWAGEFYDNTTNVADLVQGVTYTFQLTPYSYDYVEDEEGNSSSKQRIDGTPVTLTWTAPVIPAVSGLSVAEETVTGFVFTHSLISSADYSVGLEYSTNSAFDRKIADVTSLRKNVLPYDSIEPGTPYYVRAYAYKGNLKSSAYSNVVTVSAPVGDAYVRTEIGTSSVKLTMDLSSGISTGFELSRKKAGEKAYTYLITTSDSVYEDKGLEKDTKYTYRVRAYYFNPDTKKSYYGDYDYTTVRTGGAALNLKAEAASTTSIKLTWNKLSEATGYEVYRQVGYSNSSSVKSGETKYFQNYELVKTIKKKKTHSYTDKKLNAGEAYSYLVRAYKLVKGEKVYIYDERNSATTKFSTNLEFPVKSVVDNAKNGTRKVTWKKIPAAAGYVIERQDETSGAWTVVKKNGVKATSYTFPAAPLGKSVSYRIRAYKGKKYSRPYTVEMTGTLATVTGVKASANANGVTISWSPVANATYYHVYRTVSSACTYDEDTKTYDYHSGSMVTAQAYKLASLTDSYYYTLGSNTTAKYEMDYDVIKNLCFTTGEGEDVSYNREDIVGTSVTDYTATYHSPVYAEDGNAYRENLQTQGPRSGAKYYYYVVACYEAKDAEGAIVEASSYSDSKAAGVMTLGAQAVKAPTLKVKAGAKKATVTVKKVAGAKYYAIYRAASKKGAYSLVSVSAKSKYIDKKLTSKKTYYYKVKAIGKDGIDADLVSGFSKAQKAKIK